MKTKRELGYSESDELIKKLVDIATVCHESNRAYCWLLGDKSQVPWDEAPDWQKESSINGVLFLLNNPDATEETVHQNWVNDKIKAGWKYGPVKDPDKKTHPSIIKFSELSDSEKDKDKLFVAIVRALQ